MTTFYSALDFPNILGDGVNDDAPGIRAALLAIPNGATLYFPPGNYFCDSVANDAVFDFSPTAIRNNAITIAGGGYNAAYTGAGYGGTCFILGSSIPDTSDFIHR